MKSQAADQVAVAAKDLPGPVVRDPVEDNVRRSTSRAPGHIPASRARGQIPTVRTEGDRQHLIVLVAEDHQALSAACVPNSHRMVVAARGR